MNETMNKLINLMNDDHLFSHNSSQICSILTNSTTNSQQLIQYNEQGINMYLHYRPQIDDLLHVIIHRHKSTISSEHILTKAYSSNLTNNHIINTFRHSLQPFVRTFIINTLINPSFRINHSSITSNNISSRNLEHMRDMLMTHTYTTLPNSLIRYVINDYIKYINSIVNQLRTINLTSIPFTNSQSRLQKHMTGHFIEAIIIKNKSLDSLHKLTSNIVIDKTTGQLMYSPDDIPHMLTEIQSIVTSINWQHHSYDKYFITIIPHVYIDMVIKCKLTPNDVITCLNDFYHKIHLVITNFSLFVTSLRSYVYTLSSYHNLNTNSSHKFRFKGSIIHSQPLSYEIDMLTNDMLIEIKTGHSDTRKNMKKMILESLLLSFDHNLTQSSSIKNLLLINIRSNVISYINLNKLFNHK